MPEETVRKFILDMRNYAKNDIRERVLRNRGIEEERITKIRDLPQWQKDQVLFQSSPHLTITTSDSELIRALNKYIYELHQQVVDSEHKLFQISKILEEERS